MRLTPSRSISMTLVLCLVGCNGSDSLVRPNGLGGSQSVGGSANFGGATSSTGGAKPTDGTAQMVGGASTGGATTGGNVAAIGGNSRSAGGATGGFVQVGGSEAVGGTTTTGGSKATGGTAPTAGGTAQVTSGTPATGGTTLTAGGSPATGGTKAAGGTSCPFPTSFKWSSSGPLAQPKSPVGRTFVSLKDFTNIVYNGQHIVYATTFDSTASWTSLVIVFKDWPDFASATQTWMGNTKVGGTVAPTLFYFTPKKLWVLITQWGIRYATSTDPTDPSKWSALQPGLTNGPSGEIDPTVICDDTNCYLFFATSNGKIHRSSMPIGQFPGTFSGSTPIITETKATVNEAVQVYAVKGDRKSVV